MKLQISFDIPNLERAIEIGSHIADYADIIEVGNILIYNYGAEAVKQFKEKFPEKTLLADTKIVDHGKEVAELFAQAGANWITVMAGTSPHVIHAATTAAHNANAKVLLDLIDSSSIGQSAMEAKNMGADALLIHQPYSVEESLIFLDKWDMVKGNTSLPIFVSAKINRDNIDKIISLKPDTIIVGVDITQSENNDTESLFFAQLVNKL